MPDSSTALRLVGRAVLCLLCRLRRSFSYGELELGHLQAAALVGGAETQHAEDGRPCSRAGQPQGGTGLAAAETYREHAQVATAAARVASARCAGQP